MPEATDRGAVGGGAVGSGTAIHRTIRPIPDARDAQVYSEYTHRLIQAMEQYGGHFAQALARAWGVADAENRRLIETTWGEMIASYHQFVVKL